MITEVHELRHSVAHLKRAMLGRETRDYQARDYEATGGGSPSQLEHSAEPAPSAPQ
jgi:hypothetical protein